MKPAAFVKTAAAGGLLGLMLAFPAQAAQSALEALTAFALGVLPALLPFCVCARLLTAGRRLPPGAVAALGMLGGSPAGARLLSGAGLPPGQARRAAAMTGGLSPMFFLSSLALWLGSAGEARRLLVCCAAAALLAGLCFPGGKGRVRLPPVPVTQAVAEGAQAMLTVAACMAMGGVCARMLALALPLPPLALAALHALLEAAGGTRALAALGAPPPLIAALLGFGGGSVLLQNAAAWRGDGPSLAPLAGIALLRAALAGLLCLALG